MNLLQRIVGIRSYALLRRHVFCRLGVHGPKNGPDGTPGNVCCWGCGLVYNPLMWKDYIVTLKDGQEYRVKAINEHHAGHVVVYGDSSGKTPALVENVKVHRDNIASIRLKPNSERNCP